MGDSSPILLILCSIFFLEFIMPSKVAQTTSESGPQDKVASSDKSLIASNKANNLLPVNSDESLSLELKRIADSAPETNFLISADTDSRHGDVVRLIDLLKRNNLNRFALQVEKIKNE